MQTSACLLAVPALLLLPASATAQAHAPLQRPAPVERPPAIAITPILGDDTTAQPSVLIANLDDGDLVAGRTWWEFTDDVVYVETFLGFLWAPDAGIAVFEVPLTLYFQNLLTWPAEIAADRTVAGTITSTSSFESWPYRWTPAGGVEFLVQPGSGIGGAAAVSDDGAIVGGFVQGSLFGASQAARWVGGALSVIGPPGAHSLVAAGSDDGVVLVGEVGPDAAGAQATRWIDGVEAPLAPVPGATWSTALFASDDGQVAVGRATVAGKDVLVRWAADGSVTTHAPPPGLVLESIRAINPDATAAVGAVSDDPAPYAGDWDPYLWRLADGFLLLAELGAPGDYDRSEAVDVSDDGTRVVGDLSKWVFGPGSPPPLAFVWSAAAGTRDLDALVQAAGGPDLGLFATTALSGDGGRIVATGVVAPSPSDTSAVLLSLKGLP